WIEFLNALPPSERARRLPHATSFDGSVALSRDGDTWRFSFVEQGGSAVSAALGEPLRYTARKERPLQDWRRWPVSGILAEDAKSYAHWLGETGRVPGARLCSEEEWERAGRGADDRHFPHGDRLAPTDANIDETRLVGRGPDEVGSYPQSGSPFGV